MAAEKSGLSPAELLRQMAADCLRQMELPEAARLVEID